MGYCDIHNWSSMDMDNCPECIERDIKTEENNMSKMNVLDTVRQAACMDLSASLAEWILMSGCGTYPPDLTNAIEAWLDGTEEGSCPHDYIGEALSRREECAALIKRVSSMSARINELGDEKGDLSLMGLALKDELEALSAGKGDLCGEVDVLRGKLIAAQQVRVSPNDYKKGHSKGWDDAMAQVEEDARLDEPTGITVDEAPANGYVQFQAYDTRAFSTLDEFITDTEGRVYELGREMIPVKTTKWEYGS
jgi:hypothetical protein